MIAPAPNSSELSDPQHVWPRSHSSDSVTSVIACGAMGDCGRDSINVFPETAALHQTELAMVMYLMKLPLQTGYIILNKG